VKGRHAHARFARACSSGSLLIAASLPPMAKAVSGPFARLGRRRSRHQHEYLYHQRGKYQFIGCGLGLPSAGVLKQRKVCCARVTSLIAGEKAARIAASRRGGRAAAKSESVGAVCWRGWWQRADRRITRTSRRHRYQNSGVKRTSVAATAGALVRVGAAKRIDPRELAWRYKRYSSPALSNLAAWRGASGIEEGGVMVPL